MKFSVASSLVLAGACTSVSSFVLPTQNSAIKSVGNALHQPLQSSTAEIEEVASAAASEAPFIEGMPSHSPATSLENQIYNWRGYNIRYQVSGPEDADHTLLLVHGLFVNSDHWRRMLTGLNDSDQDDDSDGDGKTYRVYALDLLGSGWSDKPSRDDPKAQLANGENGRFADCDSVCYRDQPQNASAGRRLQKRRSPPSLENAPLGTAAGGNRLATELELRHPLGSPYNFFTWAEQIADFAHDVVRADAAAGSAAAAGKVTLVANSIGTMSALQSILDEPDLFNGCFVINPNFRELHSAEVPFTQLTMPLVRRVQSLLREKGHGLFKSLATPSTVTEILKEPYSVTEAIDEELVSVLLDPLLTKGADEVVFDTLSYSAGPLPEQQLSSADFPKDTPVWVLYGMDDPWTPPKRVQNLSKVGYGSGESVVEKVVGLEGAGHCPHDEVPERVNELLLEFLDRLD